jgi:phospholipid/cholesterol/gamma-HCH transport system substrate-binding protein
VLNVFDDKTGQSLAGLIAVLGNGARGNGADIDAAVQALMPALTHTDQLVHTLAQQNATLNDLIEYLQPVAAQLADDNGKTLDHLVGTATSLLHTTTTNVTQLGSTLDELPSSLVAARNTLGNLADTAANTYPLLRDIRPTTDHLPEISDELENFSDAADPALEDLVPLLHKGTRLLREAQPVARRLREAGPDIIRTSTGLRPITQQLAGNVNNVLNFIRFWALTTNGADGISHYFRAHLKVMPSTVSGNVGRFGDFGIGGRDPAPDSGQPPNGPGIPPGLLQKDPTKDGGVTGMNEKQESGALGFLTGGER